MGFKPGQSGNLKGRPKGSLNVKGRAEKACKDKGVDPLVFLADVLASDDCSIKDKLQSAKLLLGYMFGNPQNNVNLGDSDINISIKKPGV